MAAELYCEACQRFLRGEAHVRLVFHTSVLLDHHPDAEAFENALNLPCSVCSLAWEGGSLPAAPRFDISCGTKAWLSDEEKTTRAAYKGLYFCLDENDSDMPSPQRCSQTVVLAPMENMVHPHLNKDLSDNTRATSALNFLLTKYKDCQESHVTCKLHQPLKTPRFYPTRVLDVGEFEGSLLCLRDMQMSSGQGPYVCLSYCWGQTKPFTLTRSTRSALENGILASVLPQTFQDAIYVTRKLNIRFLWVDSLCIYQDNVEDWSIEAARMGAVYSQAACTIAATAAKDSNGGLFFERNPRLLSPFLVEATRPQFLNPMEEENSVYPMTGLFWCDIHRLQEQAIEEAVLNSRAWVCQERQLSPRIMHFSSKQLFWECYESESSENYPNGLPCWTLPQWFHGAAMLKRQLHSFVVDMANAEERSIVGGSSVASFPDSSAEWKLYYHWCAFRIHYTSCRMTKDEDKLVAIQGIAKHVGQAFGDRMVAGLWTKRIREELCWFKTSSNDDYGPQEPTTWRAPTWSWASSNATIWVSTMLRNHGTHANKQFWVEVVDLDVETKPSGELRHASMRVRCRLLPAIVERAKDQSIDERSYEDLDYDLKFATSGIKRRPEGFVWSIKWDDLDRPDSRHIFFMVVQYCLHTTPYENCADNTNINDKTLEIVHASVGNAANPTTETTDANSAHEDTADKNEAEKRDTDTLDTFSQDTDHHRVIDFNNMDCVEGLILIPDDGHTDTFRRLGTFKALGTEWAKDLATEHTAAEERVITLI